MSSSSQDQADFSNALRSGNHQSAGEWLVRSYAPEVFGLCLAIVQNRSAAEDLSQEVFASAFAGLSGFRGEASARTWILKIARNRCIDHLRKRNRRSGWDDEGDPDELAEEVSLPSAVLSRRADIETALQELEEVERALIVLRFSHGLDYEELAAAFGSKSGTTRMRVSRALAKMRDFLLSPSRAGAAVPPAAQSSSRARTRPMAVATPAPPALGDLAPGQASLDEEADLMEQSPEKVAPASAPAAPAARSAPPAPPAPKAPPAASAPSRASAPGSFSLPPMGSPPAPEPEGHVLQSYFQSEEAWLSINLQVRLREMADKLSQG